MEHIVKRFLNVKFLLIAVVILASFLRLYKLSVNPPSLFGDELDLGYQAYSILKTGNDYQGNFMPIHFHSLAEWRTPLYLYSAVPTVAIFGITPWGVRLPAAIFGILSVFVMYLFVEKLTRNKNVAVLSAFLMAISPWSLQYSRAGFEVTEMLLFLILGVYLFLKSLSDSKWLWLSILCFALTPWVYSTAKLFTPLLLVFVFIVWRKEILSMKKSSLIKSILVGLIVGLPIALSTLFGGGTQRIGDISVLTDSTMEQTVGAARELDQKVGTSILENRLINNKFVYWGGEIVNNYFQVFSTDFLFLKGDINLRQSVGNGQLYLIEAFALICGLGFFFFEKGNDAKSKLLIGFWLLVGAVPSTLTLGGGTHATRLILILPPIIFLISFGWMSLYKLISQKYKIFFAIAVSGLYLLSLFFYLHSYYAAYPVISEHWWHYGWGPAISEIKSIDVSYDRVIISMKGEPAWIFFAGYYQYDPHLWQKEFPIGRNVDVIGFGSVSHIGKFYFGSPQSDVQIYGLGKYIDSKTLYLANASEDGENLILHPDKTPSGLKLIKAVRFPSGEPAFYLFSGIK
jgi:4-amino-4-deoxy-L-arabinose transferase-like glycosyltransferase